MAMKNGENDDSPVGFCGTKFSNKAKPLQLWTAPGKAQDSRGAHLVAHIFIQTGLHRIIPSQ
jgi:hypothetical protein